MIVVCQFRGDRQPNSPDFRPDRRENYPRRTAAPTDEDSARELNNPTLTNLCNQRPTCLDPAHRKLDPALFAARRCDGDISGEQLPDKLLELNVKRAGSMIKDEG